MHLQNIREYFYQGRKSSSLTEHIGQHLINLRRNNDIDMENNLTMQIQNIMTFDIIWTGSSINIVNMFASE